VSPAGYIGREDSGRILDGQSSEHPKWKHRGVIKIVIVIQREEARRKQSFLQKPRISLRRDVFTVLDAPNENCAESFGI
jgi:hypothetical protein